VREHGCPLIEDICVYAAQEGHLEVLKWARANGCPCRDLNLLLGVAAGRAAQVESIKTCVESSYCFSACIYNIINCFQFCLTNPLHVGSGNVEMVAWFRDQGCLLTTLLCAEVAK